MRKNRNEEYDWINDPFDEKKLAQEREQARMSSGSKVGIGCGCAVAVILAIGVIIYFLVSLAGLSSGF